jgi:NADH-quinone oxidoreductase subunit J
VAAGVLTVTRRNPVYSAAWMLVCFLALAVVYLKLEAPFLAALHVIVYTGAILVLFLFVIMLLNLGPDELGREMPRAARWGAAALCTALFAALAIPALADARLREREAALAAVPPGYGGVEAVGKALFVGHPLPFELISVLILVAMFAGVVLAKKKP